LQQQLTHAVLEKAESLVDKAGIADVQSFNGCPTDLHPNELYPECKSVVVLMVKHLDSLSVSSDKNSQAYSQDLARHIVMHAAYELSRELERAGFQGLPLIGSIRIWPFEGTEKSSGRISLRHAAEYAGIGVISRIGIVMTKEHGPRIQLGAVLTNAPLLPSTPATHDACIGCNLCITECPSGAISIPPEEKRYMPVDQDKCLNYRHREGGNSPLGYKGQCAICRSVCPVGRPKQLKR
jgi:epoxyqueuosine reductase